MAINIMITELQLPTNNSIITICWYSAQLRVQSRHAKKDCHPQDI